MAEPPARDSLRGRYVCGQGIRYHDNLLDRVKRCGCHARQHRLFSRSLRAGLLFIEWFFTIVFTIEYVLRLASVGRPIKYAKSFFGVIDLVAIIPTYLSVILPGSEYFLAVRIIRVLRIFRVLKFAHYIAEANLITSALWETRRKITVFIAAVLTLVVVLGSLMYLIEGGQNGFTSIPKSIYWAIVTMTTVGYGDIAPKTALGQAMASFIMILGYGILAVPTGIVTVGLAKAASQKVSTQACPECSAGGHDYDAKFCKFCGARL